MEVNGEKDSHQSAAGFHKHLCEKCGYIWEHADTCWGKSKDHACPACGTKEWGQYHGGSPPDKAKTP